MVETVRITKYEKTQMSIHLKGAQSSFTLFAPLQLTKIIKITNDAFATLPALAGLYTHLCYAS